MHTDLCVSFYSLQVLQVLFDNEQLVAALLTGGARVVDLTLNEGMSLVQNPLPQSKLADSVTAHAALLSVVAALTVSS